MHYNIIPRRMIQKKNISSEQILTFWTDFSLLFSLLLSNVKFWFFNYILKFKLTFSWHDNIGVWTLRSWSMPFCLKLQKSCMKNVCFFSYQLIYSLARPYYVAHSTKSCFAFIFSFLWMMYGLYFALKILNLRCLIGRNKVHTFLKFRWF